MRILITGGAGFLGSVLVQHLLATTDHDLTVLDRFDHGCTLPLVCQSPRVEYIQSDVLDHPMSQLAVSHDILIHLAGLVGYPACARSPKQARRDIVEVTDKLCHWFRQTNRPIIHASTGSVYGECDAICDESQPCNPLSLYGQLKLEAEKIILSAGGVNLRLATLCGVSPVMRLDLLPNNFVYQAIHQKYIVLYQPHARRTFLSVQDAAEAFRLAIENFDALSSKCVNVGSQNLNLTKRQIALAVQSQFPFQLIEEGSGKDPDGRDYEVSYFLFRKATGFTSTVSMDSIIRDVGKVVQLMKPQSPWRLAY